MIETLEKLPPHSVEAEQSLLGSLLVDRDAIIRVAPFLHPDDFYRDAHARVYEAVVDLYNRREPPDLVTIYNELSRRGYAEQVGGASYLTWLMNSVPTSVHVEYYGRIVERTATMRRLIEAGSQIAGIGYEDDAEVGEALDRAEQVLYRVAQRRAGRDFITLRDALAEFFDRLDYQHQHRGEVVGVPTGFHDLDQLTGGLQRSDLVILAARPSVGKTAFGLCMAANAAIKHNQPVGIFSLEMSAEQLVLRLLSMHTGIDSHRLRMGYLDDDEWGLLTQAFGKLSEAPVFIDDTAGASSQELRSKARRLHAQQNVDLIMIDYLQLMQSGRTDNRVQEISEISRGLKQLARELNVPVIALSQLSRAVEQRQDHRPMLSDLRESGSIEQDADVVMFIYREELYNPQTDKKNIAEIQVAKHRNGPVGTVPLRFFRDTTRFADLEAMRQPD
ncbi:MAG: replicative DNA helicase [Chloroflexota bacterium]|nr:replicative DNA helicase [Chloroflexota bacterium]